MTWCLSPPLSPISVSKNSSWIIFFQIYKPSNMFHLARSFSLTTKDKSSTCPWGVASRHGMVSWKCTKISLYIDKQKKYERQRTGIKNQNLRSLGRITAFKETASPPKKFCLFVLIWLDFCCYITLLTSPCLTTSRTPGVRSPLMPAPTKNWIWIIEFRCKLGEKWFYMTQ